MSEANDRRENPREVVFIAAEIVDEEGKTRSALTRDISRSGLQLLTRARLEVDQAVRLRIYLPGEPQKTMYVSGTVVRQQPLSEEEKGTWREKVAFHFDEEQLELAEVVKVFAEEQAKVYGTPE